MSTEVATAPETPVNLENIASLQEAWQVCQLLAQSDIVPGPLRNKPANVLLVYMTGRELDLTFAQSLRTIYIAPGGTPQLRGALLLALLRRAGHDYEFSYGEGSCTTTVTRGDTGGKFSATFTLEDAEAAELVKRNANGDLVAYSSNNRKLPWMTYQRIMLRWRSVAEAANIAAPEVMMGFDVMDYASPQNDQVDLKPAAPSPAAADERREPEAGAGEAPAAELASLDARGAAASPGEPAGAGTSTPPPPAASRPGGLIEGSGRLGEPGNLGQPTAGARAKQQVAEKFNTLGWTFGEDKDEILNALTAFTRRPILMPGNLTVKEATALATALGKIIRTTDDPEYYLVALSDAIDGWEHDWKDADPDGYERDYLAGHVPADRD